MCYMVSSVEGEGKIEGYHGVYGGKLQSVYRGWVARPWCSLALHRRVGEERRLGGIWGYAAVCAITGQGGIIRGSYYGSQCMRVSAAFNKPSSWERRLTHKHWEKKAPRPCSCKRHGQGLFWDIIRTESGKIEKQD